MSARITFFALYISLCVTLLAQAFYFSRTHALTPQMLTCKESLSALVGLPDLALVNEAHYVRHRSLSSVFAYFNESPELLEYFPSTFVYHYTPSTQPSRMQRDF